MSARGPAGWDYSAAARGLDERDLPARDGVGKNNVAVGRGGQQGGGLEGHREGVVPMSGSALRAYLTDHMAGSISANDLAKRGAKNNAGALGMFLPTWPVTSRPTGGR